jgi:hypothetical protein
MENSVQSNFGEYCYFINGWGKFPCMLVKVGNAQFMQIPIHFNKKNVITNYLGTHINKGIRSATN